MKPTIRRRGLTLVETLVALAICAALLACMAVAFSAAGNAMEMNDHFYRSLQQARSGMDMMMSEIRRAQVNSSNQTISVNSTGTAITISNCPDFGGDSITFTYYPAGGTTYANCITLTNNSLVPPTTSILIGEAVDDGNADPVEVAAPAAGTTVFSPAGATLDSAAGNTNQSVSVTLTVQLGDYPIMNQVNLSGSAAPRGGLTSVFQ